MALGSLTKLPVSKGTVGCKWVYSVKHRADATIERFKACLVAKSFTQTYGVDYPILPRLGYMRRVQIRIEKSDLIDSQTLGYGDSTIKDPNLGYGDMSNMTK